MMARYPNGRVPLSALTKLVGSGGNNHYLPASTAARWYALQRRAKQETGKTLQIWSGWDAYRPYEAQEAARRAACRQGNCLAAAEPGTSPHGLEFRGLNAAAMDVGNWSEVYNGNRVAFFAAARSVGLTPGFVGPNRNGYGPKVPDEPWHLFDFNDIWGAVPAFDGASPFEEEDMTPEQDTRLKNIESILGGLQNAVNDPKIGILGAANGARDKASDANRNAENAANIASEVRNWITDPNHGVLAAISQIKVGGVDSATFSEAEINRIAQVVRDLFRTDPLK